MLLFMQIFIYIFWFNWIIYIWDCIGETLYQLLMLHPALRARFCLESAAIVVRHYIKHLWKGLRDYICKKPVQLIHPKRCSLSLLLITRSLVRLDLLNSWKGTSQIINVWKIMCYLTNALTDKYGRASQSRFLYCNLVNLQQILHYVINISDFD